MGALSGGSVHTHQSSVQGPLSRGSHVALGPQATKGEERVDATSRSSTGKQRTQPLGLSLAPCCREEGSMWLQMRGGLGEKGCVFRWNQ